MSKRLSSWLALVLCLGVPAVAAAQAPTDDLASAPRIPQAEFKTLLSDGTILAIDVRDHQSYINGHIPGAVSMPLETLASHVAELKAAKKPIVAYCA
jgi:predicted sulfurtransferase